MMRAIPVNSKLRYILRCSINITQQATELQVATIVVRKCGPVCGKYGIF